MLFDCLAGHERFGRDVAATARAKHSTAAS